MSPPEAFNAGAAFARLAIEVQNVEELHRQLHAEPRVSGDEGDTLATLMNELPDSFQKETLTGNVGIVRLGAPGVSVAIRAEMDALPVVEQTGFQWAASNGAMHACGHDVHMAAFVAVARTLAAMMPPPTNSNWSSPAGPRCLPAPCPRYSRWGPFMPAADPMRSRKRQQ
jgi:metal-dependent amidase/aminoacylase/carboxypeptidase family protein